MKPTEQDDGLPAPLEGNESGSTIGVVRFQTHRGEPAEASLDHQGHWHCPQLPVLDRVLNLLHSPHRQPRSEAPFGSAELQAVAAWLKGTVHRG